MKRKPQSKASGKFTEAEEYTVDKAQSRAWAKFTEALYELTESDAVRWRVSSDDGWDLELTLTLRPDDECGGRTYEGVHALAVTYADATSKLTDVKAGALVGLLQRLVPQSKVARSVARMWAAQEKENQEIIRCYRSDCLMLVPKF